MMLYQQIEQFTTYLQTERDVSVHTLAAYRSDLSQLLTFVVQNKGETISAQDVDHLLLRR
jgi:integrase/recombinase XerC